MCAVQQNVFTLIEMLGIFNIPIIALIFKRTNINWWGFYIVKTYCETTFKNILNRPMLTANCYIKMILYLLTFPLKELSNRSFPHFTHYLSGLFSYKMSHFLDVLDMLIPHQLAFYINLIHLNFTEFYAWRHFLGCRQFMSLIFV